MTGQNGPQQLGESRLQAFPLDLRSENFWIMAWQVHPKFSDVSHPKKNQQKQPKISMTDLCGLRFFMSDPTDPPGQYMSHLTFSWVKKKNADRPERKIITFRVSKKMIWTWCQICPHRTWGCNQWINGFLQNKNHQEWKDVKSLSYLFEPTKFKGFLKLDKYPHSQDCWCASANYITLWLKQNIFQIIKYGNNM